MNNTKMATIAIIAIAALLIAATAFSTPQALAGGNHHYKHKHKNHHGHHHDRQSSSASISQSNSQRAVCVSGSSTTGSCNQVATNTNSGNAVSASVG
jgi:hypothetical protein